MVGMPDVPRQRPLHHTRQQHRMLFKRGLKPCKHVRTKRTRTEHHDMAYIYTCLTISSTARWLI